MQRFARSLLALTILCALSACGDDDGPATPDAGTLDAGTTDGGLNGRLATLLEEIAAAQCGALFRCCDDDGIEEFFSQYRAIPGLPSPFEELQDRLPPDATLDAESCADLMVDLHTIAPFGPWLAAAAAGEVTLDEDALDACIGALEDAACGRELSAALRDTDCFAYLGGAEPGGPRTTGRGFFERSAGVDDACRALDDGSVDAYGSCDPAEAFCCVPEDGSSDCTTGAGEGTCVASADLGETCSDFPFLPCRPGLVCRPGAGIEDPSTCVQPDDTPIAIGEPCRDELYWPLGVCTDGFCNFENTCEGFRDDGARCDEDRQCASGNCAGEPGAAECASWTFCAPPPT